MQKPDFAQTASGGGHIVTRRLEDGRWEADPGMPDVQPQVAGSEKEAINLANQQLFRALNLGAQPRG